MYFLGFINVALLLAFVELTVPQGVSIQDLISQAVSDYRAGNYEAAIKGFETGLVHYRMLKHIETNCALRCNNPNISKELETDFEGFDELYSYGNLIAQANCVKICKEEHPFSKSKIEPPSDDYVRDFEKRIPYNFLQFSYYKTGRLKKACQAAYTFHQANPTDQEMRDNIAYYKGLNEVSEEFFMDLEGNPYTELFKTGVELYEDQKYAEAIDNFEKALLDYFKVGEECASLCHIAKSPTTFNRISQAIATRYIPALECTLQCDKKLRPLIGDDFMENFITKIFSYLQFSYYQVGKWEMAVPAAAAALLLDPNDEMSINNFEYYTENAEEHGLDPKKHFQPRMEAVKYRLEKKTNEEILALMKKSVDYDDELEVEEEEEEDFLKNSLFQEITKQVTMELGNRLRGDVG